jgi:hypothetical protein
LRDSPVDSCDSDFVKSINTDKIATMRIAGVRRRPFAASDGRVENLSTSAIEPIRLQWLTRFKPLDAGFQQLKTALGVSPPEQDLTTRGGDAMYPVFVALCGDEGRRVDVEATQ